jgi:CIC family chloride channel protein
MSQAVDHTSRREAQGTAPILRRQPSRLANIIPTRRLRNSEVVLILISATLGGVVGLGVVLLHDFVGYLHQVIFGLGEGRYLSEGVGIAPGTMVLVPA